MAKKDILILGASGLVGIPLTNILKRKYSVFTSYHNKQRNDEMFKLNLLSFDNIVKAFELSKPDIVLNLCGIYKNLDFCEKNKELVMGINGSSLKLISELSNQFDSYLVSMSSDFVFDGKKGNYKETDPVYPISFYGKSRVVGEKNIQDLANNFCIIRTSMIYGKNTIRKTLPDMILDEIIQGNKIKLIDDQYMTPTFLENFCSMIVEVINSHHEGILHLAGPERMTRYQFGIKLLDIMGLDKKKMIPVSRKEFNFGKTMPQDSSLNTKKAASLLKTGPEKIEISLKKYSEDFKSHNQ